MTEDLASWLAQIALPNMVKWSSGRTMALMKPQRGADVAEWAPVTITDAARVVLPVVALLVAAGVSYINTNILPVIY